jgi:hypothetical protein
MRTPDTDRTDVPGQGRTPDAAEDREDADLPGADRPAQTVPEADELPEQLGRRISEGPGSGIAAGEPDVLPDVEPPSETM